MSPSARLTRPSPVLPQPEPGLTPQEVVRRAAELRPMVLEQQEQSAERGGYSDELHEAFRRAGFYRITQPRMFGGYEFDLPVFYKVIVEIGRGDPAVAWNLALGASHAFLVASHWPEEAQRDAFLPDGEFVAPGRPTLTATGVKVPGGYRITGRWNYCSGSTHSTHFIGAAKVLDGEIERPLWFLTPRETYRILPDWGGDQTLGMRASGSNSIEMHDAFVPDHMFISAEGNFTTPETMRDGTPGTRLHGNPMYLGRIFGPFHASLVAPVIGAAWAAIDEYEHYCHTKMTYMHPDLRRVESSEFQRPLGYALTMADSAEAILLSGLQRYMDLCQRWADDGTPLSLEDSVRLWTMMQQAARLACDAVELLFQTSGAFVTKKGNRIQKYLSDILMYRVHISSQHTEFATSLGRAHLGQHPIGLMGL